MISPFQCTLVDRVALLLQIGGAIDGGHNFVTVNGHSDPQVILAAGVSEDDARRFHAFDEPIFPLFEIALVAPDLGAEDAVDDQLPVRAVWDRLACHGLNKRRLRFIRSQSSRNLDWLKSS